MIWNSFWAPDYITSCLIHSIATYVNILKLQAKHEDFHIGELPNSKEVDILYLSSLV